MYFVTIKQPGYCLFCTTPGERAAFGLTDDQKQVRLLGRDGAGWRVLRERPVDERSHTEVLVRLGSVDEPATIDELAKLATAE